MAAAAGWGGHYRLAGFALSRVQPEPGCGWGSQRKAGALGMLAWLAAGLPGLLHLLAAGTPMELAKGSKVFEIPGGIFENLSSAGH